VPLLRRAIGRGFQDFRLVAVAHRSRQRRLRAGGPRPPPRRGARRGARGARPSRPRRQGGPLSAGRSSGSSRPRSSSAGSSRRPWPPSPCAATRACRRTRWVRLRRALINVALSSWKRSESDDEATLINDGVILRLLGVAVPASARTWPPSWPPSCN
jgi:hypothetical protein